MNDENTTNPVGNSDDGYTVDPNICIGCSICVSVDPESFEMNEEGKSVAKNPAGENAQEAMNSCPVGAIAKK